MENNKKNNDSVGSSSSLGLIGSLKPFVKAGIASVTADISYLFIPIGAEWCIASRIKDEKLKKLLKSPEILKADLKLFRVAFPVFNTMNSITLGLFEILTRRAIVTNNGMPLSFYQEVSCGLLASVIGHSVTAPYITAKICMLADSHLPVEKHYRNVYDALYRISAKEGISALWTRNASLAIPFILSRTAVFASYHRSLGYFEGLFGSGGTRACLAAGAVSGFCDSVILKPSANINKRMRAMKPNSQGKYPYTSHLDCGLKILQSEGLFTLYKGYLRTIPRSIPQIMTMWLVLRKIQEFEEEFNREQVNGYIVD